MATRSSSTWTLKTDCYFEDLTINDNVILETAGFRIFCRGTLTINSTAKIQNNGHSGNDSNNTSGATGGAGGHAGSMAAGTTGTTGGNGGSGDERAGGGGGGAGGSGGFIFISARKIVNNANNTYGIISQGGSGGDGANANAGGL